MSDPWELTRARVAMLKEAEKGGADLSPRDFELMQLLADADALRTFVNGSVAELLIPGGTGANWPKLWGELKEAFNALPEHLK